MIDYLTIAYVINFILLCAATITDIKKREIPHIIVILMILVNLPIGYYFFGFDAIWAFLATLILCLILGIGMGGGDVKIFTALAPLFVYGGDIMYIPKPILLLIGISAALAAFYPMTNILKRYWKEIVPSSAYLAMVLGIIIYLVNHYQLNYAILFVWGYIILSIFISRKIPSYKVITNKLGYIAPLYLIGLYLFDKSYFISNNVLLSYIH